MQKHSETIYFPSFFSSTILKNICWDLCKSLYNNSRSAIRAMLLLTVISFSEFFVRRPWQPYYYNWAAIPYLIMFIGTKPEGQRHLQKCVLQHILFSDLYIAMLYPKEGLTELGQFCFKDHHSTTLFQEAWEVLLLSSAFSVRLWSFWFPSMSQDTSLSSKSSLLEFLQEYFSTIL